jgi:hypothetical protein
LNKDEEVFLGGKKIDFSKRRHFINSNLKKGEIPLNKKLD